MPDSGSTGCKALAAQRVEELEEQHQGVGSRQDSAVNIRAGVPDGKSDAAPPQTTIYRGSVTRCGYSGGGPPLKLKSFWQYNEDFTMYVSSPLVLGKAVYGATCVLDAKDGQLLEQHYVNSPNKPGEMGLSTSSPFVSGGKVLAGSETGGLRCYVGEEIP
jgi:hypothetical protein